MLGVGRSNLHFAGLLHANYTCAALAHLDVFSGFATKQLAFCRLAECLADFASWLSKLTIAWFELCSTKVTLLALELELELGSGLGVPSYGRHLGLGESIRAACGAVI